MGELDARDSHYAPVSSGKGTVIADFFDHAAKGTNAHMIGNGNGRIASYYSPTDKFNGREYSIAEKAVGVKVVKHPSKIS